MDSYLCESTQISLGKTFFQLRVIDNEINVGRYKHHLYESLNDEKPPFEKKGQTEQILVFTIETYNLGEEIE